MRKIWSVLLIVLTCCGVLVGCGNGTSVKKNKNSSLDVTALPHNSQLHINDKRQDVQEKDRIIESNGSFVTHYMKKETVKIENNEYIVGYDFSNVDEDTDHIATIIYDSDKASLDDAQKYLDKTYGELKIDSATGRYILSYEGKVWLVGTFKADNGKTRIVISRDKLMDEKKQESVGEDGESTKNSEKTVLISQNDVLPHNNSLKLSDTKDIIEGKENLTESSYGIEGLWDSSSTWHVENSDYEIAYSFSEDGSIQYITYLLVDSSLGAVELGFTEVTTMGELIKLYGDGENSWKVQSNDRIFDVTLKQENNSLKVTFMNK